MVKKIAIFRALYLGDMLCVIPSIRAVRSAFPRAEITLVGLPWQGDFVKRFANYFDRFIEFPGWPGLPEQTPEPAAIDEFLGRIRALKFDLVLQMHGNGAVTNDMCMRWGAKQVLGLRRGTEDSAQYASFPISEDGEHEVLRFLKLIDGLQIGRRGTHLEFPITKEEDSRANDILIASCLTEGGYVCVHPGARDKRRRWPVENFGFIANHIAAHGLPVVLTGSMDEKELLADLQHRISTPVVNIVERFGHLGAGELAAVLGKSRLLVSNDTGVSHIAAALAVPSVIVFSPYSEYGRWRPLDNQQHIAIPSAMARDTSYVLERVTHLLGPRRRSEQMSTAPVI